MNKKIKVSFLVLIATTILLAGLRSPVPVQANHSTVRFTEDFDIVVPASETCGDEAVHIFGTIDVIIQTTTDVRGGAHLVAHFTPHLNSIGLSSGESYLAVGPTQEIINVNGSTQNVSQWINIIQLISPGSGANLTITEVIHFTVNANGDTTVSFDNIRAACHG